MHHYTEEEITQAYLDMASTPAGEIILADLIESFYDIHPHTPNDIDVNKGVFVSGMRWVVGYIKDQCTPKDPDEERDNHTGGSYL